MRVIKSISLLKQIRGVWQEVFFNLTDTKVSMATQLIGYIRLSLTSESDSALLASVAPARFDHLLLNLIVTVLTLAECQ